VLRRRRDPALIATALLVLPLAVGAQGCTFGELEPSIQQVLPASSWTGEDTSILVLGENFHPLAVVDARRNEVRLQDDFQVELVAGATTIELEGVSFRGYGELSALVPEGTPVGVYDLHLIAPEGGAATLADGFTVRETRADHIELDFEARTYEVDEQVVVRMSLLDPLGELVPEAHPVRVTAETDAGSTTLELYGTGLADGQPTQTGIGLSGSLHEGEGWVALSSSQPANVWLTVESLEAGVDGSEAFLPFTPGELGSVAVGLPTQSFQATAGEAFVVSLSLLDDKGNLLPDTSARLQLSDECHGAVVPDEVDLVGQASLPIIFLRASELDCPETSLVVTGTASGQSSPFVVASGEPSELLVRATDSSPEELTAGDEELMLRISARDDFGNRVGDYDATLDFIDDAGGLDTRTGAGSANCVVDWDQGERFCLIGLTRAGDSVRVTALASDGLSGTTAEGVAVTPAEPSALTATHDVTEVVAGESFELRVRVDDAYGNPVELDLASDGFLVDDGSGSMSCTWSGTELDEQVLDCVTTTAAAGVTVTVELQGWGIDNHTDTLDVVNAALAEVQLSLPVQVSAGEAFTLQAEGYDAYGNPYLTGDRQVDLSDDSGTLNVSAIELDGGGRYAGSAFTLTRSGTRTVTASTAAGSVGTASIDVEAAELSSLAVELEGPVVWVGEDSPVRVRGVDSYGNTVPDYSGPVSLSSSAGLFITSQVSGFSSGELETTLSFDSASLQDRIEAVDGDGYTGRSARFDALDDGCVPGPTAALSLDGGDEAVACLVSGTATVAADFSGSSAGSSSLAAYHLGDGAGGWTRSTGTSASLGLDSVGVRIVELVVADSSACGAATSGLVWVNEAGQAAGPLTVTVAHSSRTSGGSASTADTTVTVTATDCAGDVPTDPTLYVRTDLGELTTGVSTASDGLTASLSSGSASFTWSGQSADQAGTVTLHAGVLSGAAHGSTTLELTGESHRPQVAWMDPAGASAELLEELVIGFTEDLLSTADYDSLVDLSGPDGAIALSASLSGDELTLSLQDELDASAGAYELVLSADVRDAGGNKLDGDFDGTNASWSGVFGDVGDEGITLSSCTPDTTALTPDGADGVGQEADEVDLSAVASSSPTWWLLEVYDAEGVLVRTRRVAATAASQTLTWDARDDDGRVLDPGTWTVDLSSIDGSDNLSAACSNDIELVQHYLAPE
jgi:hypothetical protein